MSNERIMKRAYGPSGYVPKKDAVSDRSYVWVVETWDTSNRCWEPYVACDSSKWVAVHITLPECRRLNPANRFRVHKYVREEK